MTEKEEQLELEEFERDFHSRSRAENLEMLQELSWTNATARAAFDALVAGGNYGAGSEEDLRPYVSNHSGYSQPGSEGWEHDDTGNTHNYSAMEDEAVNASIAHKGWEEGYDYSSRKRP